MEAVGSRACGFPLTEPSWLLLLLPALRALHCNSKGRRKKAPSSDSIQGSPASGSGKPCLHAPLFARERIEEVVSWAAKLRGRNLRSTSIEEALVTLLGGTNALVAAPLPVRERLPAAIRTRKMLDELFAVVVVKAFGAKEFRGPSRSVHAIRGPTAFFSFFLELRRFRRLVGAACACNGQQSPQR